MLSDPHT